MLNLPKAILFDLDDTIISYDGMGTVAWDKACNLFIEERKPEFDKDNLLLILSRIRKWYWSDPERHRIGRMDLAKPRKEIVRMALGELNYFDEAGISDLAENFNKLHDEYICLFPDSIETLEKLRRTGTRMALLTNGSSKTQRAKIDRFSLSGYFEFYLIEEEVGYGKPDIRVFEKALEMLGLKPHEAWMIGDNLVWDVEAPQKIGIYSIWNDYKKKGLPADSRVTPDRIVHGIAGLLE
ncbi:MAG: HAD family hydrolase [Saccharofermentanales bacterium]